MKITRKQARTHLKQFCLACELSKLISHYFPDLLPLLRQLPDPRNQSYITYPAVLLLMTRILSSIFYISSMRKTSEEFNSDTVIENMWEICGETEAVDELPYWETINRYLERLSPDGLQEVVNQLCRRLLRSRVFENMRVRGKYWQIIIMVRSCTVPEGNWTGNACTASIIRGKQTSIRKAIIMCWRQNWCCTRIL